MSRVKFVNKDLQDIPDSFHTYIPRNCEVRQVAINYPDGTIEVNKQLWEKLDENNKGALILHEILYEDTIKAGLSNSIPARLINAYIHGISKHIFDFDSGSSQIREEAIEGILFDAFDTTSDSEATLKKLFQIIKTSPFKFMNKRLMEEFVFKSYNSPTAINYFVDQISNETSSAELVLENLARSNINWSEVQYKDLKNTLFLKAESYSKFDRKLCIACFINLVESISRIPFQDIDIRAATEVLEMYLNAKGYESTGHTILGNYYESFFNHLDSPHVLNFLGKESKNMMVSNADRLRRNSFQVLLQKIISKNSRTDQKLLHILHANFLKSEAVYQHFNFLTLIIFRKNQYENSLTLKWLSLALTSNFLPLEPSSALGVIKEADTKELMVKLQVDLKVYFERSDDWKKNLDDLHKIFVTTKTPLPKLMITKLINSLKNNDISTYHYDYYYAFALLNDKTNMCDDFKNYLAYSVRVANSYEWSREKYLNILATLDTYTPYVYSVFEAEIKMNFSKEKELLQLFVPLKGKNLSPLIRDMLTQLSTQSAYESVKSAALALIK